MASAKRTDCVFVTWVVVIVIGTLLVGNGRAVLNSSFSNPVSLLLTVAGEQGDNKTVIVEQEPLNDNQDSNLTGDDATTSNSGKVRSGSGKRSAYFYPGSGYGAHSQSQYGQTYPPQDQPFCYDRDVSGSCRYRMDPYDCDQYKWTAYATIQNIGGIQQLRSIPEGLYIPAEYEQGPTGTRDHLRVYLTVTCCIPIVQFLSVNPYHANTGTACIVDVRQLQGLNPAEIGGVVIGVVSLLIIIVVVIGFLIRRRRSRSSVFVGHPTPLPTPRAARDREREVLPAE